MDRGPTDSGDLTGSAGRTGGTSGTGRTGVSGPAGPSGPADPAAAADVADVAELDGRIAGCRACPRLVEWREEVARTRRAAFADQTYWGRPVPGFGPADASLLIVGLAPAAHGANRTGRMFTGDRSGDVLYAALHEVGLASRGTAVSADDGLTLRGVRITSPVRCAPPANKPTPEERDTCRPWLVRELELLRPSLRAVVVLGAFGWQAALPAFARAGWEVPRPRPAFAHGARVTLTSPTPLDVFGCFHVSQRNTFTGRLTPAMLREVLRTAASAAGLSTRPQRG
ncbi:uracil-DNA glycosylase [Streptomyces fagopyri]|uniref:uracil-DNA glycosylase n=1 Tax=Streptomyces fagopyri TaxID=2662397 RepID=UPI0033F5C482